MTPPPSIPSFVHDDLAALELALPPEALEHLADYLDLLLQVNQRVNLTAARQRDEAWRRLIIDSLTLLPGLDDWRGGSAVIDIGSGGGLPGIPLAVIRPDLKLTLLEATGKKVRFLEQAVQHLGLENVVTIQERAESLGQRAPHRQGYDVAVCRAVGVMSVLLEYALPLIRVGGRVLAMKGPKAETELGAAADALALLGAGELAVYDAYPASFGNDLVIVSIVKDRPTPATYPRRPGVPKSEPL